MKRIVRRIVEETVCDVCQTNLAWDSYRCLRCGQDHCYDCAKTAAVQYSFALYFSGSADGCYCLACDNELRALSVKDPLHTAYARMASLRSREKRIIEKIRAIGDRLQHEIETYRRTHEKEP